MMDLGQWIYQKRLGLGVTQESLSLRTGIPQPNLSNIEKGKQDVTFSTLQVIAKGLGMELSDFFKGFEGEKRMVFDRDRVELLALAIVTGNLSGLRSQERQIADWFRDVMPKKKRDARIRRSYFAWSALRKRLSRAEIKLMCERVRDVKIREGMLV